MPWEEGILPQKGEWVDGVKPSKREPEFRQGPAKWKKTISKVYTPVLETVGFMGGAIAGAAATPELAGIGAVPMAGVGYATGKSLSRYFDELLDLGSTPGAQPGSMTNALVVQPIKDITEGMAMEMGGRAIGKAVTGVNNLLGKAPDMLITSQRNIQRKAAQEFQNLNTPVNELMPRTLENELTAGAVLKRTGTQVPLTPAQRTGNIKMAAREQSYASKDPEFMERMKTRDAEINQSGLKNVRNAFGPPELAPIQTTPKDLIGKSQVEAIEAAKAPVKARERELWGAVPKYEMAVDNFTAAGKELTSTPLVKATDNSIKGILSFSKKQPKTVQGMQAIERTIRSEMSKASRSGDRETQRALGILRDGVRADIEELGLAAESGDIAVFNGKLVYPAKLEAKAETLRKVIAIEEPGVRTELQQQLGEIENILANAEPAENAATAIKEARSFSLKQNFERFDRGAVKDVLRRGDEITGRSMSNESVPSQFFTPSGAAQFIKAVGKEEAKKQIQPYAIEQMVAKSTNPDGTLSVPRAMAYIRQNGRVIDTVGIRDVLHGEIRKQIPAALQATLESKGVDVLGNPIMTAREASKVLRDYGPGIKAVYGKDSKQITALQDYHKLLEMIGRNKNVSASGGSTTTEKLFGSSVLRDMGGIATYGHGFVGAAMRNLLSALTGGATKYADKQAEALIKDAILNPETAEMLMKIAKTGKSDPVKINEHLIRLGVMTPKYFKDDEVNKTEE